MKFIIRCLLTLFTINILLLSINAYSHDIPVSYSCDGFLKPTIDEIPCIMKNKLGWNLASRLMYHWFSDNGKHSKKENEYYYEDENCTITDRRYIIPLNKVKELSDERASEINSFEREVKNESVFNDKLKDNLLGNLKNTYDSFSSYKDEENILETGGEFNHISSEISAAGEGWKEYKQEEVCSEWEDKDSIHECMHWIKGKAIESDKTDSDEFTGAFEKAGIRLVVKGLVDVRKYNGQTISRVTVNGGGVYFKDSYDFQDDKKISQPLGCWGKTWPYLVPNLDWVAPGLKISYLCLSNKSFRNLDESDNNHHDFRIFTDPEKNSFSYKRPPAFYVEDGTRRINNPSDAIKALFDEPAEDDIGTFTCDNITNGFKVNLGSWGGQCVPYVRKETGIEYECCNGYAKNCYDQAQACGYEVGSTPELGSIVTFNSWNGNPYGHVGIVIDIDENGGRIKLRHSNWHLNELVSEEWVNMNRLPIKGYIYCEGDACGGGGPTQPDPTDPPVAGLPDFITDKVTLANKSGNKERYTWKINETAYVHSWTDNIGDADWEGSADKIKVPFYLSKGTKEDRHSEWKRIAREQIKKNKLKRNKPPKHEYIKFNLQDYANDGTIMPGRTYNFVVCADRPHDEDNGDGDVKEKHKSNNCSTEAVFYVDYGPARNVDLMADMFALTGGRTQLQAGEKYGLQLEVSNIGTEQPWNGFLTSYEMKGPSTGNAWQRIGEDTSKASSLYPGAIHFEAMDGDDEMNAPMVGGDYVFRACTDYTQAVPETDESNNCTTELPIYVVPPPMPDLITEGLQLTHGRTSLIAGELYGLTVAVRNIGNVEPASYSYTNYAIKGPGTGDTWQQVADDGSKAEHLAPGATHWEEVSDNEEGLHIPDVPGTYTARACADYKGNVAESDEGNNCSEMTFDVEALPPGSPVITITNPTHDDEWRSDERKHIEWTSENFSSQERVKVEYSLDGGKTWDLVDDTAVNDGGKYWDMCDSHTEDTDHAYIRITSLKYPYIYDDSDEFTIDHAKECE